MRVLFWNQEYFPSLGGVEIHTARLAKSLGGRGHDVAVVAGLSTGDLAQHETIDGIEVHRLPFYGPLATRDMDGIASLRQQVVRLKRQVAPEIVHVNLTDASPMLHLMTAADDAATVVAFHRALSQLPSAWGLARSLARRAAALVAPSEHAAADAAKTLDLPPISVTTIENGIPSLESEASPLPALPPPEFLAVGRLVSEKAVGVAIRALRRLHDRGVVGYLRIAGTGDELGALRSQTVQLGLEPFVIFEGLLDQHGLNRCYERATALLVPSVFAETFCQAAAEAALAGRPVLASRIGALPGTVVDGETGLLFPPGDYEALSALMVSLVSLPGRARQLGEAARTRARRRYGLEAMTDQYEDLYRSVVRSRSTHEA